MKKIYCLAYCCVYILLIVTSYVNAMQKDIAELLITKYVNPDGTITTPIQHLLELTNIKTDKLSEAADQTQQKWFNLQWNHSQENGFNMEVLDQILKVKKELNISSIGTENKVSHLIGFNGVPPSIIKLLLAIENEQKNNDLKKVTIFSLVNTSTSKALQEYSQQDFTRMAQLFGKAFPESFLLPTTQTEATEYLRMLLFPSLKNVDFEYIEYIDNSNDEVIKAWALKNNGIHIKVVSSSGQLTSHLLKFHSALLPNNIEIVGGRSIREDDCSEIEKLYHDTGDNPQKKVNFILNDISRTLIRINSLK